jgi:hypothetical protein
MGYKTKDKRQMAKGKKSEDRSPKTDDDKRDSLLGGARGGFIKTEDLR